MSFWNFWALGPKENNALTEWKEDGRTGTRAMAADGETIILRLATHDDGKAIHMDQTAEGKELNSPWRQGVSNTRETRFSAQVLLIQTTHFVQIIVNYMQMSWKKWTRTTPRK